VAEAREIILTTVTKLPSEQRKLLSALGQVLDEDVLSPIDLPPWDNSAMDGFAVLAEDLRGAAEDTPRLLGVIEDVPAGGHPTLPLRPGEATRVMTGAPVPKGADSVVRVEHTDGGHAIGTRNAQVKILSEADAGRNIRRRGEDVRHGDRVLRAGTPLRAAELGMAASLGRSHLAVIRRPRVAILASGDELVDVDEFAEVLAGRRIVSSNSYALAAQLLESGMEPVLLGIARDDPDQLRRHLQKAEGCDAVISSAGVSVGEHDHLRDVVRSLDTRIAFWRVRMRPGSPFVFGQIGALGGIPWFGLPGNPVSTMVTFEVFVRPALLRMAGHRAVFARTVDVRFRDTYPAKAGLTHFVRVRLDAASGEASLTGSQSSGVLSSMSAADALLVVPKDRPGALPGDVLPAVVLGGAPLQEAPGY
jgi:molybdopterin molybdotransferase